MLACPNINTKEWKDLEKAIGQREAFREYMRLGTGQIPALIDIVPLREVPFSKLEDNENSKQLKEDVANDLIDFLNSKFPDVKGAIINDKAKKWKGKLDGKTPTINLAYAEISDGFHEFSHPFLMALRKSNPETFNSLYNDLKNSEEWNEISERATERVNKLYPELRGNVNLDLYKEEVLATAIGYAAELKLATSKKKISSRFGRVIDSIFKWLNSFFKEFAEKGFADRIKTNNISPNTTFGEIIDIFTDTRSQIILDSNWDKAVDNLRIADAMIGAITTNQELMSEQLTADMSVDILTNSAFTLDDYINEWLNKNFKVPKREYKPRKVKPSQLAMNIAQQMIENVQKKGAQLKGIDFKQVKALPEQFVVQNETVEKLASVLTPVELNYKFSNYLTNKKATSIALNQPLVTIKDVEGKDEEGNIVMQPKANIPISIAEAEAVIQFQNFIKDKFPGRKSMPADEINEEYLSWVTENYGINWTNATGHSGFGIHRISNAGYQNYTRVLFIDDYFVENFVGGESFHTFKIDKTGYVGNGLGWYVTVTIQGDRFDHEFQSDILPEILKHFKLGLYSESLPEGKLKPQNRKKTVENLARTRISQMLENSHDFLIRRYGYLSDQITTLDEETINSTAIPIELQEETQLIEIDDLPFSKLDNYDYDELERIRKFLLSEVNVQINEIKSKGWKFNSILVDKLYSKMYNLFLGRKNDQQKELFDWINTFKVVNEADAPPSDILPFSKTEETPFEDYSLGQKNGKVYYLTQEGFEKFPKIFRKIYDIYKEWSESNAPIKPNTPNELDSYIRTMAYAAFTHLIDKNGGIKKNYGYNRTKVRNQRDVIKDQLEKLFKEYNVYKTRLKGLEWRQTVYQDVNNIIHIAEYYKGQYNRLYRFYDSVYETALPIAQEKITAKDRDPQYERYKKYYDLYNKWFDIIVPQSINSAKAEGRPYYYLPTAMAMNAIEGNPNAEKVYWTPSDGLEEAKKEEDNLIRNITRYVSQNTPESANVIRQYLSAEILNSYNQNTTSEDIAYHLYNTSNFANSDEFNKFLIESGSLTTKPNGPLYNALVRYARKNKIKLTFEQPSWSKKMLIKVDLTNYTIKPIDRFSKIDPENFGNLYPKLGIPIKPGVDELFSSTPELASIGTPEQYSQYLDTIFPDSKVKDIVYHVNRDTKVNPQDGRAFYSTSQGSWVIELEEMKGKRKPILINIKNPTVVDSYYEFTDKAKKFRESGLGDEYVTPDEMKQEGTDAVIGRDSGQSHDEYTYVTYKVNQVHELGSKQDIEEFKSYVQNKQTVTPRKGISEVFAVYPQLAAIGTQEQYERYLSTIFPNSKVRDILYHGTNAVFDIFDKKFIGKNDAVSGYGFYFSHFKESTDIFGKKTIFAIINLTKPSKNSLGYGEIINKESYDDLPSALKDEYKLIEEGRYKGNYKINTEVKRVSNETSEQFSLRLSKAAYDNVRKKYDGVYYGEKPTDVDDDRDIVVFEPEQIHRLGSEQDIEGFKKWMSKSKVQYTRTPFIEQQKQEIGQNIVMAIAGRMMNNLGIKFNVVTPEQARKITEGAQNPWNGEKAFFYNGQTYFLSEGFTTENVLHEYSHPLVDAIFATNKELFNKLYDILSSSEEGMKIIDAVSALYPEYKSTDPMFRKEVLVRALAAEAQSKINETPITKEFKNFIERIIFAIKQALRKVFGTKVKVEKLSTDTTLKQLADMLVSKEFNIDTELITDKDYVEYLRDVDDLVQSLKNVENSDLSLTIDRFYQLTSRQIFQVMKNKNYAEARKILINEETKKGLLQEIKATLETTPEIDERLKDLLDEQQIRQKNAKNFVHSINRLDILTSAVNNHMRELLRKEDNQEVLTSVFYYDLLVRNWSKFIEETNQRLFDAGMDEKSELGRMLSSIQTSLETTKRLIREAYTPGVFEVLKNTLKPLAEDIDRMYKEQLEKARKAGAPQKAIDDIQKKWDATKLTDERVMDLLLGEAGDTNPVSAFLEAYTNSPDPIVGGFAVFLKNAYTDVDVEVQRNANDFMKDMAPLLEAAGYSRSNFTKLMEKLAFLDEMTYFNSENGKLEKKKVWTFLNEFMNIDSKVKQYNYDYEQALENGDQVEADRILKEKRKHLREYFNQEYIDEYYAREDVYDSLDKNKDLEDVVYKVLGVDKTKATTAQKAEADALYDKAAKEAYRRKQLILSEIKELDGLNYDEKYYDEVAEQKSILWRQYSRIASLRDVNGQLKFGEELLVAMIEKKYRKVSNDIFEWKPITGQFDFALERYEQSLIDSGLATDDEEFKEKRKKWIKDNTVIKYTDKFYTERNETLSKLKRLLNEIKKRNPSLVERIDSTEEIEEMLDLSLGFRDQNGQIIGDNISDPSKNRFRDLQEAIIRKKESYAGFSGLTAAEDRELSEIFERLKNKTATAQDRVRLNELMEIKNELGIDKATQLQLQKLYKDLAEIQSKEATDYYVEQLNDWLTHLGENPVDNDTASSVLSPEMYIKLFKASPEFEKWFKQNHISKEVYDKKKGESVIVYERLFIWNRTRPNNPDHFQSFKLASGEVIPGVPTLSYHYRTVKEKYKTQKIVGKNVDNRGRFLPKTLQQGAPFDSPYINKQYEELRNSDPAAFKVLEKMKEYHLKWQETIPFESKLYMQVPRYRSMASENLRDAKEKTVSRSRRIYRNIRDVFVSSKDNYQDGLNFDKAGQLVDADMFDEEIRKIPITGLYDLKPEEVSMNFLDSMLRYMHSGIKQRKLVELNPFAQALKSVVEDPNNAIKISGKFIKSIYKKTGRKVPIREKGQSVRSKAISNLYDREFKGIKVNDFTRNMPALWKLKSLASNVTSLGAFALNIPSALKNRQGAIVQGLIEASGGRWMSRQSYWFGKGRAWKMMSALSSQVYVTKNKSLDVQLMQIFDPSQDFFKRSIETQFGRSLLDDAANLSILMFSRKFLQLEATLEVMCGMLYHIKVPQTINGQTRELEYINAFEIKNGQIQLKPGIDAEWAPGGSKFKEVKNKIHEVGNRLEGTYGEFDAAEIDRTFFGSAIKFMKKFFTPMFMNWFAMERKSVALGTVSSGNYIGFLNMMGKILKYGPRSVMWASESDMAGFRKTLMQIATITFHYLVLSYIFGYDPDDEERFAKMKAREKESWGGWVFNHAALLTLGTLTETETWTHPYIFYYTAKDLASPKHLYDMYLKKPFDFVDHTIGIVTGDKGSFYKQDVGPYWFQKEGAPKIIADVAKIFGFTGGAVSPAKGMKSLEDARKGLFK